MYSEEGIDVPLTFSLDVPWCGGAHCVCVMRGVQVLDYVAQKAEVYELQDAIKNWKKKVHTHTHTVISKHL
jgi:hypothetical protein